MRNLATFAKGGQIVDDIFNREASGGCYKKIGFTFQGWIWEWMLISGTRISRLGDAKYEILRINGYVNVLGHL